VSLCNSFPTLFDLVDESATMEVDGVDKADYGKVVEHCYLCDLCYQTKCPYTPPHEWAIDFPHLMLRAKAVNFKQGKSKLRDRILTSTDAVGKLAGIPVVAQVVNATNKSKPGRVVLDKALQVHQEARLPEYHSNNARKRLKSHIGKFVSGEADEFTKGRVALFTTCYCNRNEPDVSEDLVAVFEHNGIPVTLANKEKCCGMPKMELGDFESVAKMNEFNIPILAELVGQGWDLVAPIPSCVLMFKKELPLLFPDDEQVNKVSEAFYGPFEYLMLRHKGGKLCTDFSQPLGRVVYHTSCHQRVQNIGRKTFDLLSLIPDTEVELIERCSGHDGTYAVKKEFHEFAMKIGRPVVNKVRQAEADHYGSDCPMAGRHIQNGLRDGREPEHPLKLMRRAYGI
jgi:Fe-S oxidoreductase